ncbi:MAG: glycine cleavage system protein GcvH [Candidatus Lokiarchaeota archaeon]|nr:glycine cleavage system protein GcvH [Candidatus Lokiarchaeota archaeon]
MVERKTAILPCNGLDKALGVVAGRTGIIASTKDPTIKLVCPVLLNTSDPKYDEMVKDADVICVNGCMTRCATKLAETRKIPVKTNILVPDMVKRFDLKPGADLVLQPSGIQLAEAIADDIIMSIKNERESTAQDVHPIDIDEKTEYFETQKDKFYFKVPKNAYMFNENDCWVRVYGKHAYLGISDFLQNQAGDILFIEMPAIGKEFGQFDDVGTFESVKTVLDLISPVSGKVIAVNKRLASAPELANQDPYHKGWFVKVELADFEEDKSLLLDGAAYFEFMKKNIEKEANKTH